MILTTHVWSFNFDNPPGETRLIICFGEERSYVGRNNDCQPTEGWFTIALACHSAKILRSEKI